MELVETVVVERSGRGPQRRGLDAGDRRREERLTIPQWPGDAVDGTREDEMEWNGPAVRLVMEDGGWKDGGWRIGRWSLCGTSGLGVCVCVAGP